MHEKSKYYISKLQMNPHPEGGYYKEIYRSGEIYQAEFLPGEFKSNRNLSTSIYFLLDGNQVSTFHRLKSDEIWHYYDGCGVKIHIIEEDGILSEIFLGNNLDNGEMFQVIIKSNNWFAAELVERNSFSLIGCTVSPGFDFEDFELGDRNKLLKQFPQHKEIIKKLTKFRK